MAKRVSGDKVRNYILRTLHIHRSSTQEKTAKRFGIPKSQVEKHMSQLAEEGKLKPVKNFYVLDGKTQSFLNPIAVRDREDEVYRERILPLISALPDNVQRICYYGFTEMYNNAVDHSEGSKITVHLIVSDYSIEFMIRDDGVGIFDKIKKAFGLEDHRQVLVELVKGGLTTDPERHSGQGIFFTSRAFDSFNIISEHSTFSHVIGRDGDWLLDEVDGYSGTLVVMAISKSSDRKLSELFNHFTVDKEELKVFKTHAPLRLSALAGGDFVSRSQAKRVLARFEKFEEVFLDFEGVDFIGQAFADEVFRVFPDMNTGVQLIHIHANDAVRSMIEFARRTVPTGPVETALER